MWRAHSLVRQDTSRCVVQEGRIDVIACTETLSLDSVVQNPHPFSTAVRVRIHIRRQGYVYVSDRIPVAGALSRGSEHLKVDQLRVIEHGTSGVPLKQDYHCQMIAGCDDVIILF